MDKNLQAGLIKIEDVCVLLISFNRPDLLQKRILELKDSIVRNIYISIDGGPGSHTPDIEKVKALANSVLKNQKLHLYHHKDNLGMVLHETGEISRVLNLHKYAIIIEDDIKISENFLTNMVLGLNKLEELDLRGIVSGYSPLMNKKLNNKWRKTHITFVWGWAISSNNWEGYKHDLTESKIEHELLNSKTWQGLNKYQKNFWISKILRVQKYPLLTYDFQLCFHSFKRDFTNLAPIFSMIDNEGFDDSRAVHTKGAKPKNLKSFKVNNKPIFKLSKLSKFYTIFDGDNYYQNLKQKLL
jgi:hypothetical protein